ncbi:arylsulfatase [Arenibacter palladensis]|uniref:arylsulfatase n=1 Tax=Arenibacter palladensis TaxID=237373 RepID=UPI0026E1E6DD|nr:arylsulfatase [Arenibacter palladensis]MDO6602851.1 arylsulfatase [Arenibacter palladensis]
MSRILLIITLCIATGNQVKAQQPNVILIMADDQGYGDISAHGNPVLKTPELDKLYGQSVRFTDFHVAPMCTPTRGQLMTGIDALRNGATEVNGSRSVLRSDLKIMPQYFSDAGYRTGMFGKWHLGDGYPFSPQFRGFDEVLRHRHWGITSSADYWGNTYFDPVLEHNGEDKKYDGYCTDIFFNEAMDWMKECQDQGKPFFVYLPTNTPHTPNVVADHYSKQYKGKYNGLAIPDKFYGMIANLDENIGRLESFLTKNNLRDNTILIYLSDNGSQSKGAAQLYNAGMRDNKTSLYDGGHRVPLFVRWPHGKLGHGSDISELAIVQDILPTLADFCKLDVKDAVLNGKSLAGLLQGKDKNLNGRMACVQYIWKQGNGEKWDRAAVLWNKWRLVNKNELYNVANDPGQKKNIIESNQGIAQKMVDYYDKWYAGVKADINNPQYFIVGTKQENPVKIYSNEWVGDYCTNPRTLIEGKAKGYWNIDVAEEGTYEIELRRWPEESKKPIIESYDGKTNKGAISAVKTRLRIGGYEEIKVVNSNDAVIRYTTILKKGKTKLTSSFMDVGDEEICGAMYVKITRK